MTQEALKLALKALEGWCRGFPDLIGDLDEQAITAIKEALAQPEEEPVATLFGSLPVYDTTTPQRTWVGLAAEDRLTAKYMQDAPDGIEAVIDYIEAKLKEMNSA